MANPNFEFVLWENSNFTEIEGSEGSSPNGLVLDEESNTLYISYNLDDKVTIFDVRVTAHPYAWHVMYNRTVVSNEAIKQEIGRAHV